MKRILSFLLGTVLLLTGCAGPASSAAEPKRYQAIWYDVFDTSTSLIAYCDSQEEFDAQAEAIHNDLKEYHRLYDIYNEYEGVTNLYTLNATAADGPVEVDERIIGLLTQARELYTLTGGQVNVALGSVLRLWHDARTTANEGGPAVLPEQAALEAAALHTGIDDLVIDAAAGTVYFADPALRLDVGSCGKGYACEMVVNAAVERGLTSFSLSVGGNTKSVGVKPGAVPWTSAVENPHDPDSANYAAILYTSDLSLVTSGDYRRYLEVDGVQYHHLIDPDTLWPADHFSSVSILCADSGLADCLSTGVFCMTLEEGRALIEGLDGVEAFWILPDGSTVQSSGWAAHER